MAHTRRACFIGAVLTIAWSACGGEAFRESSSNGSGGTSSASGPSSGTGASSGCDLSAPCFPEGATCSDGSCCPCIYECRQGAWDVQACAGCAGPSCPYDELPATGAACDICSDAIGCQYEDCAAGGTLTMSCVGGMWQMDAVTTCDPPPPCGPDPGSPPCPRGTVCVEATITAGPTSTVNYSCEQNPCSPQLTSCACAQPLCDAVNAPFCIEATPRIVHCDNGAQ